MDGKWIIMQSLRRPRRHTRDNNTYRPFARARAVNEPDHVFTRGCFSTEAIFYAYRFLLTTLITPACRGGSRLKKKKREKITTNSQVEISRTFLLLCVSLWFFHIYDIN